jgi:hypothetical protein
MNAPGCATASAALPTRTPGASGRKLPANPLERLNDVQLIAARDKLRDRLENASTADQPRPAKIAAAFGLITAEVARRIEHAKRAGHRQDQPGQ